MSTRQSDAETFQEFAKIFLQDKLVQMSTRCKADLREKVLIEGEDIDYVRKKKDGSVGFYKGRELFHEVPSDNIGIEQTSKEMSE